jgi:hypothetical protein
MTRKNRIMIFGPKDDGTYVVEFRTAGKSRRLALERRPRFVQSRCSRRACSIHPVRSVVDLRTG